MLISLFDYSMEECNRFASFQYYYYFVGVMCCVELMCPLLGLELPTQCSYCNEIHSYITLTENNSQSMNN